MQRPGPQAVMKIWEIEFLGLPTERRFLNVFYWQKKERASMLEMGRRDKQGPASVKMSLALSIAINIMELISQNVNSLTIFCLPCCSIMTV